MTHSIEVLNHIIRSRRSIFPASYTGEEIPRQVIGSILANANYAPTHKLTEPWRFRVFRKKGLERLADKLAELYKENTPEDLFLPSKFEATRTKVLQSSCVIAIVLKRHHDKLPEWEELSAVACSVQNMWLTATALNIGAYWSSPAAIAQLGGFLQLDSDEKCIGIFYMGYHSEPEQDARRTPVEEKVTWIEE